MKKILLIGAIALVIFGCVLAAGCTSTNSNTIGTDSVIGTWTLPNGTTVVFGDDFKGVMTQGENNVNFTWKKTNDGKYQVDNEKGEQVIWTLDNVKGTMTNAAGAVLSKQTSDISGTISDNMIHLHLFSENTGKTSDLDGEAYIKEGMSSCYTFTPATKEPEDDGTRYECIGYYTQPNGGGDLILKKDGKVAPGTTYYTEDGKWKLSNSNIIYNFYANWDKITTNRTNVIYIYGKNPENQIGCAANPSEDTIHLDSVVFSDPDIKYCLGYYTEPEGGIKIFNRNLCFAEENIPGYVHDNTWVYKGTDYVLKLYGHYSDERQR